MAYGTIADWRAYAAARGNDAPANASDVDASAALERASDYIRTRYVIRMNLDEAAENVIEATYIAASLDLAQPGLWATTFTPSQARVLTKVDSFSWTPVSSSIGFGADKMLPTSPAIDALLTANNGYHAPVQFAV